MNLSRRTALTTGAAALSAGALIPSWALAEESPEAMAALGVIYALPLVEMYATRRRAEGLGQAGRLLNAPRLADASSRAVTTPNVDTLYSSGWMDLAGGATSVELPPAGPHYFSLAFMDAWSNNFVVLPGAGPGVPGRAVLTGPGGATPADGAAAALRSPTRHVWMLGRTFAASNAPDDLAAAHAVQAQLKVQGSSSPPNRRRTRPRSAPRTPPPSSPSPTGSWPTKACCPPMGQSWPSCAASGSGRTSPS